VLGLESCEAPGARCGSTYASNRVMGNRHGGKRICYVAYRLEKPLKQQGLEDAVFTKTF
jgi:hypothetical protein